MMQWSDGSDVGGDERDRWQQRRRRGGGNDEDKDERDETSGGRVTRVRT